MSDSWQKRLFLLPAVFIVLAIVMFPLINNIVLSFTTTHFYRRAPVRFSLNGWINLLQDKYFLVAAKNTLIFVLGGILIQYPLGLFLALLLNGRDVIGRSFFRSALLVSMLISPIAAGFIVGRLMFNESIGPLNDLLRRIGLGAVPWLSHGGVARLVLILIDSWQWAPFFMLFLLTALDAIPNEPYEAARVDGANSVQIFFHITLPLIVPVSAVTILIRLLMMFRVMDLPRIVTAGGPGMETEMITMYAYSKGIAGGDLAYGAATSIVLLVAIVISSSILLYLVRKVQKHGEI